MSPPGLCLAQTCRKLSSQGSWCSERLWTPHLRERALCLRLMISGCSQATCTCTCPPAHQSYLPRRLWMLLRMQKLHNNRMIAPNL